MFVLGITGGISSGKSTVAGICSAEGIPPDADQISSSHGCRWYRTTGSGEKFGEELMTSMVRLIDQNGESCFQDKRALDR